VGLFVGKQQRSTKSLVKWLVLAEGEELYSNILSQDFAQARKTHVNAVDFHATDYGGHSGYI